MGNAQSVAVESQAFCNNVPFVIEPVEIPLVSEKISIIDDSPVHDMEPQGKDQPGQVSENGGRKKVKQDDAQKRPP